MEQKAEITSGSPGPLARLFMAGAFLSLVGTFAGFIADQWWAAEMVCGFRVQFLLLLTAGLVVSLVNHRRALSLLFAVTLGINVFLVAPYFLPLTTMPGTATTLKLTTLNVHTANQRYDLVLNYVASHNPDIAFFTEVNDEWLSRLQPLTSSYPYTISRTRNDNFGVVLFSRVPPQTLEIVDFLASEVPSVKMVFSWGSSTITLVGTHPLPPRTYEYSCCRNAQLELMGSFFGTVAGQKILLGDLNTVPWSGYFHRLLQAGGLKDTSAGRGIAVTWPSHAWWLLGIPIDHCLVSPGIGVASRVVGPTVGSDHYPISIELAIP